MVKRISHKAASCPVARPLDAIGDSWSLLIVREIFGGKHRFGELQQSLGVAKNVLAQRLRNLVEHGVIVAASASDGGKFSEYRLTTKGRALFPLLVALRQWGEEFFFDTDEEHVLLVDRKTGSPVRRIELRAQDGRLLTSDETAVIHPPIPTAAKSGKHARRKR